jgi:hypothetical protein
MARPADISTILTKIQLARTPEKFDGKFIVETLGLKGGWYRAFIPFAKRIGLLTADGTPSDLYRRFRGEGQSSTAIAEAMRIGYAAIFSSNEKANTLEPSALKALFIQVTGNDANSSALKFMVASFAKLKDWAKFGAEPASTEPDAAAPPPAPPDASPPEMRAGLRIAYTINLNLPETSDPAVFNAIFKALKEHLLKGDQ